ncbi:MAG: hypothetical protein ABFS39_08295 [Pseudomonadota bacterium]
MDIAARQTKLGQAGLLMAAFATPFAVMAGTGGYAQAQPVEASGNSIFVIGAYQPTTDEIDKAVFFKNLSRFFDEYGLGKNQMAALLNVSRPTIYSWLEKEPERIRESHRNRLSNLLSVFDKQIDPSLRHSTSSFLQKRLDPIVRELWRISSSEDYSLDEIEGALKSLNFKLSGMDRSKRLSEALKNKKPLI